MVKDKKVRKLVLEIKNECLIFLNYVESLNECAYSDRMIEGIINKTKELEKTHYSRFEESLNEKCNDTERGER